MIRKRVGAAALVLGLSSATMVALPASNASALTSFCGVKGYWCVEAYLSGGNIVGENEWSCNGTFYHWGTTTSDVQWTEGSCY